MEVMEGCATNASALSPFLLAETAASGEGGRAGAADAPWVRRTSLHTSYGYHQVRSHA